MSLKTVGLALSIAIALFGASSSAVGQGRIVAGHDVNTLSSSGAGVNEQRFAVNVACWLTRHRCRKLLLVQNVTTTSPLEQRDYSPGVIAALGNAGFATTVVTAHNQTLCDLESYGAVFVGEEHDTCTSIDQTVLTDYVRCGGGVYVFSGDGACGPAVEAGLFNTFLCNFGLEFNPTSYDGINTSVSPFGCHPIFNGVLSLASGNGQEVRLTPSATTPCAANEGALIVKSVGAIGVYGVYDTPAAPPGTVNAGANRCTGPITDVLKINSSAGGSSRTVHVPASTAFSISLSAAPCGPTPCANYVVWVWRDKPDNPFELNVGTSILGSTVGPTPFQPFACPRPILCLRSGLPAVFCCGIREFTHSPRCAPWSLNIGGGLASGSKFTLQGAIQDNCPDCCNQDHVSVTNVVTISVP